MACRCSPSSVCLQCAIDLLRIQVDMQIVPHHHGRGSIATSKAHNWKQREPVIRGCFTQPDAEALAEVLAHTVVAQHPAAHTVANHDHMTPNWLAKNQVVKGRDTIQVRNRHPEMLSDIAKTVVGDPAPVPLHDFQRINADGLTGGIARGLGLDLADLVSAQHRAPPYRSISASTKSMTPKMAIRSGTMNPRQISGSICM